MTAALLLIDIQNDYFPGGKMALERMDEAAASAREAISTLNH
jgi:nicotinamidase-related amidase